MSVLVFKTLLILTIIRSSFQRNECDRISKLLKGQGYLELMNSPELKFGRHQLRVVFRMDQLPGDKIYILQDSPSKKTIFESSVPESSNYIDTNVINEDNNKYSVEYTRKNGTVIATSEMGNWSGWMQCINSSLGPRSIGKALFPGSHDAGSYIEPKLFNILYFVDRYLYTQDETIENQLERGARYLDLRIAYYPGENAETDWWLNHDVFMIRPFIEIINQIKQFLKRWPNEIILLDFHRFPSGFEDKTTHDKLATFLINQFSSLLHKPSEYSAAWSTTFNDIWASPARIILSYNDEDIAMKYNFYPPVTQLWANVDNSKQLYDYFNEIIPGVCGDDEMTSAMAELTPKSAVNVIFNKYGGLRSLAAETNANITINFATGLWGESAQAVAVDFLSSSGIVSAAILRNVQRADARDKCN